MSDKTLGAYQRHEKHDADVAPTVTVHRTPDPDYLYVTVEHPAFITWGDHVHIPNTSEEWQATAEQWERRAEKAGHERDEARAERDHFHEVAATFRDKFNAAESHPLTPDAITDKMVERARKRGSELVGALWDPEVVEAMLTAALTPEPERPDGAEEIEAVLREEWTFSDEDGGGDAFGDLAQRLASRGVRVVGEEDR